MLFLMYRTWVLALLSVVPVAKHVCGIEIYTPREVEAVNGTDVKLKCTFSSTQPVSRGSVSVAWTFRSINGGADESVFFYHDLPFPPPDGRFKDHVVWSGNVMNKDVSITLQQVPPTFNGTYICQVRNLPDVHGINGEIILKVINKVSLSEIGLLAAVVGGACGVILVVLGIIVAVRYMRNRTDHGIEVNPGEFEKGDPTVCSPAKTVLLTEPKKKKKAQSLDYEEPKLQRIDDDDKEEEDALGCGYDDD